MADKKTEELNEAELDQLTGGALLLPAVQAARESYAAPSTRSGKGHVTPRDAIRIINKL